jgi:hypothetical protein
MTRSTIFAWCVVVLLVFALVATMLLDAVA